MSSRPKYHEALLHWIWQHRQFDFRALHSASGKTVQIHNTGTPNSSDGPDFSRAEITVGNLRWFGDVEIHWQLSDWKAHGHHKDANFNNVVLQVVYQDTDQCSRRQDGTPIPTLCLEPYLSQPLQAFVDQYRSRAELPCAGQLSFISEKAFIKQLEQAHKEYFEQKVDDLLEFYDPHLPPSRAWVKMLGIAFCDGLGIAHNRAPMRKWAETVSEQVSRFSAAASFRTHALKLSGLRSHQQSPLELHWNHKGCRPGNHPESRIRQAADGLWHMHQLPFKQWMHRDPEQLWQDLLDAIIATPSLGRQRASILFGTVFLPALYTLGNLFFASRLKSRSWELWRNHRAQIPGSLLRKLHNTDLPPSLYAQKLGTIYQLRAYCHPRNCQECKVFKNAISS